MTVAVFTCERIVRSSADVLSITLRHLVCHHLERGELILQRDPLIRDDNSCYRPVELKMSDML
jgi:hypothetical protein